MKNNENDIENSSVKKALEKTNKAAEIARKLDNSDKMSLSEENENELDKLAKTDYFSQSPKPQINIDKLVINKKTNKSSNKEI